jgi:hypothetical protein
MLSLSNSGRANCSRHVISRGVYPVTDVFLDLQNSLGSLLGIAGALHALWDGTINSRRVLTSVGQLYVFWLVSLILHITMPTLVSVGTATVLTPVLVEVDTIPGNIIDLGANLTLLGFNSGAVEAIYSDDLLSAMSAVPYIWENRNASIRLPLGVNETSVLLSIMPPHPLNLFSSRSLFSTPSNVSSSEYVIIDPYAHSLSVRCGVVPPPADAVTNGFSIEYSGTGVHSIFACASRLTFCVRSHVTNLQ